MLSVMEMFKVFLQKAPLLMSCPALPVDVTSCPAPSERRAVFYEQLKSLHATVQFLESGGAWGLAAELKKTLSEAIELDHDLQRLSRK